MPHPQLGEIEEINLVDVGLGEQNFLKKKAVK